jgi:hypothetical protein
MKEIVVCVVRHGDTFLLLHRISNKSFDPDRWEFISGFVGDSEDLVEKACSQVSWETGLDANLVIKGSPFVMHDEYGYWKIHPFLFDSSSTDVVLQPAEHTEFVWVAKEKIIEFDTVKDLDKNLIALGI